jgi:hypothetical protein
VAPSSNEIIAEAKSCRIPFGKYSESSVYDVANSDPEYLRFILGHAYALNYHKPLKKLIIRTMAVLGIDWH